MLYKFRRNSDVKISPINPEFNKIKDQFHLYDLLSDCWCEETCAPRLRNIWSKDNMTCGQCSITAFIVQDIFGGEVYGIETSAGVHCFNKVGEIIFDLTSEQFSSANELKYTLDNPQTRECQFSNEEKYQRYIMLKNLLIEKL